MYHDYSAAQQVSAMYYDMVLETDSNKAGYAHACKLARDLGGELQAQNTWVFPDGTVAELTAGGCWIQ